MDTENLPPPMDIAPGDHAAYMRLALAMARRSPPKPTNFCVGAVLVDAAKNHVLATGYTLELPGNTHAEQCCLMKLAVKYGVSEERLGEVLGSGDGGAAEFDAEGVATADADATAGAKPRCLLSLYTTMEPCSARLSGNLPCVHRVLRLAQSPGISLTVYVGVTEPDKFVADNTGRATLKQAGVSVVHVGGLEAEILAVATAGHGKCQKVAVTETGASR